MAKLREVRSLTLTVCEAHRLPLKLVPNPYCVISLNQVKVARTNGGAAATVEGRGSPGAENGSGVRGGLLCQR